MLQKINGPKKIWNRNNIRNLKKNEGKRLKQPPASKTASTSASHSSMTRFGGGQSPSPRAPTGH